MKNNNRPLALLCWLAVCGPLAAETGQQSNADFDRIVVTAARTPLTISQVGAAVTVITREQIERRETRRVSELLRSVPGFAVSHSGVAGSQTQVRVRGAEANHILVLIDGVRANDPATGDEFRWEFLSTGNIERIEIVRGPQSSLWGSDAVSAVVHIITRRDQPGSSAAAYVQSGSFATTNAGLDATLSSGRWSLSGGIEHLDTDGINIARSGSENDDSDLTTASASMQLAASDSLSFSVGLRATDAYSQFDPVDFFVTGLPADGDVATAARNLHSQIGTEYRPANGSVSHSFNARYFDSDNQNLLNGSEDSSTAADRLNLSYQANIRFGENRLALALEHEKARFEQTGAIIFGDPNQRQEVSVRSAVAEFQNLSSDRLSWILSARFDDNSEFDDALNGRLAIAYRLSDATSLRSSIGTGRKNPTFTERYGFFPGQFIGNPELKPERSTSYDLGIDQSYMDGVLRFQLSVFRQNLKDEINGFVFDPATFLSTAENSGGKSERSGAEFALQWSLTESMAVGAYYTYLDSTEPDSSGNESPELRRPRHSGGLSAEFQSTNRKLSATLNADYGGDRYDIFFPPFPNPSEIVTLDSYWLLDIAAHYRVNASVVLFAKGSNLLDESYEQVYGYRTSGRSGSVGVRMSFGL